MDNHAHWQAAALAGCAVLLALTAGTSTAAPAQSRTVDRTFVCTPIAFGGVGDLDIYVSPPADLNFNRPTRAYLLVRTGGSRPDTNLVFVRDRSQVRYPGLTNPEAVGGPGGVFAHRNRCVPVRTGVPLTPRGLPGPPDRFRTNRDCPVRGRVVVRVRATLRAPTDWRTREYSAYAGARQAIDEASLAVRSQRTGKPIAYMELDSRARTKFWYSSGCG